MFGFEFETIGSHWHIEAALPFGETVRRRLLEEASRFDRLYSRFRTDSLVADMAAATCGGRFSFPEQDLGLFELYDRLFAATSGAVDPLVGRDLELLGYDGAYSLRPDLPAIAQYARERRAWDRDVCRQGSDLITRRSVVVDVGAAGKGHLVDLLAGILREHGFEEFVVDGSGDMVHAGKQVLTVGLEHPGDAQRVIGIANLRNRALCASAINRRAWGNYHHVLDARTGQPTSNVVATFAVADNAAAADGLATALFFACEPTLRAHFEFTSVRMFADGHVEISPDFDGEIFLSETGEAT
ncbi:FAD:protein FMN transferase [Rhizobium sp. CF142]|uniref:FAD:protein FMN transferase n=1 Tax=Rhizobium sp. CF142 TaxID=1144314 RepID=UPI00026EF440|nr:FAD:protein FMN transferase [Rhizobium sp. CF142]EJJ29486.1 membrane-associated lipoprotein involved in thiamine biosynthesis [Rhizobium sp. CF142]